MSMPKQQPGKSKQDYETPKEFLLAVKKRLGIETFAKDVAASDKNSVAPNYFTEERDGLASHNSWYWHRGHWAWCNPPYADIKPWVAKACAEAFKGAQIACLVPAAVGANWWKEHVENNAYVLFLNGRLTFGGCKDPYPKDCALLLYVPWRATGNQVWNWRDAV